jgi:hypothetical protein
MSKNVKLSQQAYVAPAKRKPKSGSFNDVLKRLAPPPLGTFGDLEKYLENLEGSLFSDMSALERVKARKKRADAQ